MSSAVASAKKRRGVIAPPSVQPNNGIRPNTPAPNAGPIQPGLPGQPANNMIQAGLSLPQIIQLIDRRLIALETRPSNVANGQIPTNIQETLDEYNSRFEILVSEIDTLKDIVLKLQSYTMDVNKTLLDERIHILSDFGSNVQNENISLTIDNALSSDTSIHEPNTTIIANDPLSTKDEETGETVETMETGETVETGETKPAKSVSFALENETVTIDPDQPSVIVGNDTPETDEAFQKFQAIYNNQI
jgi:hypothetical protein